MVSVVTAHSGRAALDLLGRRLDELRGGVLEPAVVVCPNPVVAVGVRRALGRRQQGLAGVETLTIGSLVRRLTASELARRGQHVANKLELLVAIRAELAREPGLFGAVANHRTTDDRLLAFQQELLGLGPGPLTALERQAQGLSVDALRVVRNAAQADNIGLSGHPLTEVVLECLERTPIGALGPIIIYQPEPMRAFEGAIIQALARRADGEVHVCFTGNHQSDEAYAGRLAGWSIQIPLPTAPSEDSVHSRATLLEVADPEDEVNAAIAYAVAMADSGVRLSDMALLYPRAEPYASMAFELLEAAGLPFSGPGHRPLAQSLAGRTLRRLLRLAIDGLERSAVMVLLASAPIDDGAGSAVAATRWDQLSRQAGVVDGSHWKARLAELAGAVDSEEDISELGRMSGFVAELADRLAAPEPTWQASADWGLDLLDRYLLTGEAFNWPDDERRSLEGVREVLEGMRRLAPIGPAPTLEAFEATLASELGSRLMPGRPLGRGIYVGPLASVSGLSFERVYVVGLAEGQFPRTPREDPLLTDQMKGAAGLIEKSQLASIDEHQVALAAAASRQPAVLLTARGDLRSNRSRSWPAALDPLVGDSVTRLSSHYQLLASHGTPASSAAFGLRSLIEHVEVNEPVHTHPLASTDPALAAALRRHRGRSKDLLGPYTGKVGAARIDPTERTLSATALETYARCPRRYFLGRVLRLKESDRPERIAEMTPMQRGNLVHLVLERFLLDILADHSMPKPGDPWTVEHQTHLFDLLAQEVKAAQSRGETGGQVKTVLLHRSLISMMDDFLDTDNALRAEMRSTPRYAEFQFGMEEAPPLKPLAGREMRLRGLVDRIDETDDDGLLIIDYKTGKGREFNDLGTDPLKDGTRLQLPLYARDMAERLGRNGPMWGVYWVLSGPEAKKVLIDDALVTELEEVVGSILDGISDGLFPGIPGEVESWPRPTFSNCRYCDFDRICPTDRQLEWQQVRSDEVLIPIDRVTRSLDPGERATSTGEPT